jgi:hypothetical protein
MCFDNRYARGGTPLDSIPRVDGMKGQVTVCISFAVLQNIKGCQRPSGLSLATEIPRAVSDYMQRSNKATFRADLTTVKEERAMSQSYIPTA